MTLDVITFPSELLRKRSKEVEKIDNSIIELIENMKDTLLYKGGYGLAAPQVAVLKRIILVDINACKEGRDSIVPYINPVIIESEGENLSEEGCFSVPDEFASVKRFDKVKVRALNTDGKEITVEAHGQHAKIFQHEIDHLNGVLFIDKLPAFKRDTIKKHIRRRIKDGKYEVVDK